MVNHTDRKFYNNISIVCNKNRNRKIGSVFNLIKKNKKGIVFVYTYSALGCIVSEYEITCTYEIKLNFIKSYTTMSRRYTRDNKSMQSIKEFDIYKSMHDTASFYDYAILLYVNSGNLETKPISSKFLDSLDKKMMIYNTTSCDFTGGEIISPVKSFTDKLNILFRKKLEYSNKNKL